jgi:alkylated DNA repair dioxygenase AlkB
MIVNCSVSLFDGSLSDGSLPEGGDAEYYSYAPHFLEESAATDLLARLWRELDWSQREIMLYGRRILQPRLVAWYGDAAAVYTYSGLTLEPLPWHPLLLDLSRRIEAGTGYRFNAVLANAYRDGRDSMGWHADNEKELGLRPVIASLSLGAPRRFLLRPAKRSPGAGAKTIGLTLEHGSLLLMKAGCQQHYRHALPRTRRAVGLRINLTYRLIVAQAPD